MIGDKHTPNEVFYLMYFRVGDNIPLHMEI